MSASGFYHCSVKSVGRAKGRSVVAAAAYRSGERLRDERTGEVFDYRARGGVLDTFILAPEQAPEWAASRERLWNEAERAEPRANGRLATELELALPHELSEAARKELLHEYLGSIVERYGVAADVAIHAPGEGRDHRNIHAHALLTHREIGAEGFEDIANPRMVTKKVKGVEKEIEIAGIAATPADIRALRQEWEHAVNRAYERAGLDIRVDHRSHEERGIEQEPTQHLGPSATAMERRGADSERGEANREITQRNAERQALRGLEAEAATLTAEIKAEREGRYDRLSQAHREAQREQFDGRYDALREAEPPPEAQRVFESGAGRTTERAQNFDRDAANAEWAEKVAAAGIARDEAARGAWEARQRPERAGGAEARAGAETAASGPQNRPEPEDMRPLGKTAGEIRTAWTLTRGAKEDLRREDDELETALAARGMTLAQVTPEEARHSEHVAALAKEIGGRFGRVLTEGEIVAVDGWGNTHRLDERTTGDLRPEIEARLAGIDRASLMNVTAAKEAMREASRTTARDDRRMAFDMARAPTAIETRIAEALSNTMTGIEFADALDKAGLTIARADAADVLALDALRQESQLAATAARTEGIANSDKNGRNFAQLAEGDFAAVTPRGDVFRLNPTALDFEEAEQRLADTQSRLPSVVEARAVHEINREKAAAEWAQRQEDTAERATARFEGRAAEQEFRAGVSATRRAVQGGIAAAGQAGERGFKTTRKLLGGAVKVFETGFNLVFGWAMAPPKLTRQQAHDQARAETNQETIHAREHAAGVQADRAAQDSQIFQENKQQQEKDLRLAQTLGLPPTAEANLREHDRERER